MSDISETGVDSKYSSVSYNSVKTIRYCLSTTTADFLIAFQGRPLAILEIVERNFLLIPYVRLQCLVSEKPFQEIITKGPRRV